MAMAMANGAKIAEKDLEVKPLTYTSPSPYASPAMATATVADEEASTLSRWSSTQYLRRRRVLFWCCGCCGATVVVLGLVILILAFTVFKVKDPVLTLNNLYLDGVGSDVGTIANPVSVNATLTADVSIENPNVASFRFDNSTTEFYYQGETVGVGYAPDGSIGAHKTLTMNVTVEVLADRVGRTNATGTVFAGGQLNVTTFTDINGRVNVWGIYKRNLEVTLNCSMSLDLNLQAQEINNKVCVASVR